MDDFISGAVSGLSQNIIGHPFDTIKVLKQNNMSYINKNPMFYYRGFLYPSCSQIIVNSLNFTNIHTINKTIDNYFISGFISGFISSPIVYIFDVGKIKNQTNPNTFDLKFKPITMNDIINKKGKPITCFRECIGFGTYFSSYNYLREKEVPVFLSGGIAGIFNWFISYPIDVLKTRQLTKNITIIEAIRMKKFYKGLGVCLLRAGLVNSVGFYAYESSKRMFN
jgi:hypothetical protein